VHGVGVDAVGEIGADGAFGGLFGISRAHQIAIFLDGVITFEYLNHHGAGDHEIHQVLEKRPCFVHRVETLGVRA